MTEPTDLCVRCKYDIRGIGNDQPCPECGLLAERSRHLSERLRDSTPGYLRKLSIGTWMTLLAVVLPMPLLMAYSNLTNGTRRSLSGMSSYAQYEPLIPFAVGAILLIVGVWFLTSSDERSGRSRAARLCVRIASISPLLFTGCIAIWDDLRQPSGPFVPVRGDSAQQMWIAVHVLGGAILVFGILPLPLLVCLHLRHLGKRLLSRQIAEHSIIVGIGISATILVVLMRYVIVAALDGTDLGLNRRTASNVWLGIHVTVLTSSLLFGLWTLYLLTRFAIAFASESRALRKLWREADRSGVTFPPG